MDILRGILRYKSSIIFTVSPFILLPLPLLIPEKESFCAYTIILMGIYWMTEVIPLAVTSLLPLILFPAFGLMGAKDVSKTYMSDTIFLFIGGLIIAIGVEQTELHKRISLRVLSLIGSNPKSLMFGFMVTTFFLSMWISNTASTAMILPIVEAVCTALDKEKVENEKEIEGRSGLIKSAELFEDCKQSDLKGSDDDVDDVSARGRSERQSIESAEIIEICKQSQHEAKKEIKHAIQNDGDMKAQTKKYFRLRRFKKGLTLCVPYAASIGGTVTINGTGTNVVFLGQYNELFPKATLKISFASWMLYVLPSALLFFFCAYLWLAYLYMGLGIEDIRHLFCRKSPKSSKPKTKKLLQEEYQKLGQISWSETTVLVIFAITALLWLFRDPGFIPGWAAMFKSDFVDDGTIVIATSFLLFVLPSRKPEFLIRPALRRPSPVPPVLTWRSMQKLFPWNVVLLTGGGFAIAQGATTSGLSAWLGKQLVVLQGIEPWIICILISAFMCLLTEFTTNVATAALFVPVLATLAQTLHVHPIYLLVPPILATSMAFMLPVATPPNAIAFSYGHLKVMDMVKAGCFLNVIGVVIVTLFINTYGVNYFGLNEFPDWARQENSSAFQ